MSIFQEYELKQVKLLLTAKHWLVLAASFPLTRGKLLFSSLSDLCACGCPLSSRVCKATAAYALQTYSGL